MKWLPGFFLCHFGQDLIKLFFSLKTNKLECLSLSSPFQLSYLFQVRLGSNLGQSKALTANIGLGRKCSPLTNTLAYLFSASVTKKKTFYGIHNCGQYVKAFLRWLLFSLKAFLAQFNICRPFLKVESCKRLQPSNVRLSCK